MAFMGGAFGDGGTRQGAEVAVWAMKPNQSKAGARPLSGVEGNGLVQVL